MKHKLVHWIAISAVLSLAVFETACSTLSVMDKRVFLDSTLHEDSPPSWVKSTQTREEKSGTIRIRSTHTVRGNERVNGCFDLARLDAREVILTEIAADLRGRLDEAQQSLSESAELVLTKSRSQTFEGKLNGMKFNEEYFERYRIGDQERIDCFVQAEMSTADYQTLKRAIVDKVTAADPRLKATVLARQIQFFSEEKKGGGTTGSGKDATSNDEE